MAETITTAGGDVTLADLHAANIARQAEWCPDQVPDLSFRGNELGGECGEAQNVIKKLERERLGWRGSRATVEQLAEELADVVICADLCAVTAGIDLGAAVAAKFNATSEKVGLTTKLAAPAASRPAAAEDRASLVQPSLEAMKAAVELEIQACIGRVTTSGIGELIDRVAEARVREALAQGEAARG